MERYALERTAAPAARPLTLAQAKRHCRVDHDGDDDLIGDLIDDATDAVEAHLGQALITQTYRLTLDRFPGGWPGWTWTRAQQARWSQGGVWPGPAIDVPMPPLLSVTGVTYVDPAGATQTLPPALYDVDARRTPGRIAPAYGTVWPVTRCQLNAVTVTFTAGYGADGSGVPGRIKRALLLTVGDWYENREQVVTGAIVAELPTGAQRLLALAWHGHYA